MLLIVTLLFAGVTCVSLVRAITLGGHWPETLILLGITVVCLIERINRRKLDDQTPPAPWEATSERFIDPESGRLVQVWQLPATGERRYLDVGQPAAPLA